ncbi:MAG: alpha-hydroxy-acid oxidizing protein [Thermoplasmata archaeon]|nr:alpha-hydroxy-acid oxidizing protein [Thermoplasmata archaeon]
MDEVLPGGFLTLSDLEETAKARSSTEVWAYVEGGAGEELTASDNHAAFRHWSLLPRHLAGIRSVDLRTSLLGHPVSSPIFVAPTAYQGLVHSTGEVGTAKAASAARTLAMFSTLSSFSMEEIAAAAPTGPRWFQLYLQPDFAATRELVGRAERSGYSGIVLTVDAPVLGSRDRQTRDGVAIRSPVPLGNGPHIVPPARIPQSDGEVFVFPPDATATWEILERLGGITRLPLVVKGILTADDARRAVAAGARAVVVSNHGGRQLDRAVASVDALAAVVAAVGSQAEVYMDGGIRRGSDILVALALGARGVGVGRPVLWALAAGGERGVSRLLSLLQTELAVTMMLTGRRNLAEVGPELLRDRSA